MLPYCIKQLCLQLPGLLDMQVYSACRHLVYTDPSQTTEKMLLFTLHDIHFCFHISESLPTSHALSSKNSQTSTTRVI